YTGDECPIIRAEQRARPHVGAGGHPAASHANERAGDRASQPNTESDPWRCRAAAYAGGPACARHLVWPAPLPKDSHLGGRGDWQFFRARQRYQHGPDIPEWDRYLLADLGWRWPADRPGASKLAEPRPGRDGHSIIERLGALPRYLGARGVY